MTCLRESTSQMPEAVQIPPTPWDRTISFSDVDIFRNCRLAYKYRKQRRRKAPRDVFQVIGDLTHRASAEDDDRAREADLSLQLERIPAEQRVEAEKVVRELLDAVQVMDDDSVVDRKKEFLLSWTDPVTGWKLKAKPDDMGMVEDDRDGDRGLVLQVTDNKTAERLSYKHKEQVFFFGLVVCLAKQKEYFGPIKLVVQLLRSRGKEVFWYSRAATERNLRSVRWTIRQIEECVANDDFEASPSMGCDRCPYRNSCPAFKAWQESERGQFVIAAHQGRIVAPQLGIGRNRPEADGTVA